MKNYVDFITADKILNPHLKKKQTNTKNQFKLIIYIWYNNGFYK